MENELEKPLKEPPFLKRIKLLDERVAGLEEKLNKILDRQNTPVISPRTDTTTTTPQLDQKFPIPMEYREIINTVLNGNFGITVEPMSDRPAFTLNIIVPEKYSNMSLDERKMKKVDLRSKVISYAEGSNGVRQYAELVANNLGPEIRSQIIMDRANLV